MKQFVVLSAFICCLVSCKKETTELIPAPIDPLVILSHSSDSCSYTIDGRQFICDKVFSEGKGNSGANLDTSANQWKWNADTLVYSINYGLNRTSETASKNNGQLVIHFLKKYGKNQLVKPTLGIMAPVTDTALYIKGIQQYAINYNRFNDQNGIAMEVTNRTDTSNETLFTYIFTSAVWATTLKNDCQDNAQFEILHLYTLPDGSHLIEAKFTANLFTADERSRRLENGYLRLHVD